MSSPHFALVFLAALGCGLVGGIFFAFSTFVMAALARIAPAAGIAAMQSINIVVINPWFFAAFFGTAALCALAMLSALWRWSEPGTVFVLAGGALYLVGTIGVTILCNVPFNNALAAVAPAEPDSVRIWTDYVARWTAWNHVRTAAAFAAAALLTIALCLQARGAGADS